jgi:hypothetical protein
MGTKLLRFNWTPNGFKGGFTLGYSLRVTGSSIPFSKRVCGRVWADRLKDGKPITWGATVYGHETSNRSPWKNRAAGLAYATIGLTSEHDAKKVIEEYWLGELSMLTAPVEGAK